MKRPSLHMRRSRPKWFCGFKADTTTDRQQTLFAIYCDFFMIFALTLFFESTGIKRGRHHFLFFFSLLFLPLCHRVFLCGHCLLAPTEPHNKWLRVSIRARKKGQHAEGSGGQCREGALGEG